MMQTRAIVSASRILQQELSMKLLCILACYCLAAGPVLAAPGDTMKTHIAIVPAPRQLRVDEAAPFVIRPGKTHIVVADASLRVVADYLSDVLRRARGRTAGRRRDADITGAIVLKLDPSLPLNDEGYRLASTPTPA